MGSAASAVPLWVLTAALLGAALGRQPFTVCNNSCCTVLPSCGAAALRVSCNYSGASMTLRRGEIPHSVLSLSISHAKQVIIHEDAVNDLSQLTNFSIRDVDQVEIRRHGMALSANSEMRSVKFEGIGTLRIESNAFSGVWQARASIRIGRVSRLHMKPNALAYMTAEVGPSLDIWQVDMLDLSSGGVMSPLYYLKLNGVTMITCNKKSFHGKIDTVTLNNVTIIEVMPGCFSDLPRLIIQSSNISTVETQGFVGRILELKIKDTTFEQIKPMGVNVTTTTMQIGKSRIEKLFGNGISAKAKLELKLEDLQIDNLTKDALVGLNLWRGSPHQTMELTGLVVPHAEDGSLAFADCAEIRVSSLHLTPPYPRVCPTEKWVRQLTGAEPSGELSTAQYQIFQELWGEHLCDEDRRTSLPKQRSGCETETRASDEDFIEYDDKWYDYVYAESGKEQEVDGYMDWEDQPLDHLAELSPEGGDGRRTVVVNSAEDIVAAERPEEADDCVTLNDSNLQPKTVEHSESIKERELERNDDHETNTDSEHPPVANHGLGSKLGQESNSSTTRVPNQITDTSPNLGKQQDTLAEPAGGSEVPSGGEGRAETPIAHGGLLEQHQMLVFLVLGAVLSLAIVLLVSLLFLVLKRRRAHSAKPAPDVHLLDLVASIPPASLVDSGRTRPTSSGSEPASMEGHFYEEIKEPSLGVPAFPAPLPPQLYQNTQNDRSRLPFEYERLLDR
ncbi:uncharacterized protein LOC122365613 [Amphibalanus amphitrite]|uniref:uncharacterized protein LOC122365613 n=1 Tax=Amphibalanus amphitrite TaxID=1232801 RepID=UPI001C908FA5|nr:uncharacterized protein LOC122365613 [Amphibalanus amphitrite]